MTDIRIDWLQPEQAEALLTFMDSPCQGHCYCQYWTFAGGNEAWLSRPPEANRERLLGQLPENSMRGLVATRDGEVVGWMRVETGEKVEKLAARGAPTCLLTADTLCILCFAILKENRRKGVASSLVSALEQFAAAAGFTFIAAFPDETQGMEDWMGPQRMFERREFEIVGRMGQRLAMLKTVALSPDSASSSHVKHKTEGSIE